MFIGLIVTSIALWIATPWFMTYEGQKSNEADVNSEISDHN